MSLRAILTYPDDRLATICAPVTDFTKAQALAQDMLDTMYDAPGRGLAAPQVGVLRRMFVMDATWKEGHPAPVVCINPEVLATSDEMTTGPEACLSIPGLTADIERHVWVDMKWQTPAGDWVTQRLKGFASVCAQHEYDHLNGIVIFDRLDAETRAQKLTQYEGAK